MPGKAALLAGQVAARAAESHADTRHLADALAVDLEGKLQIGIAYLERHHAGIAGIGIIHPAQGEIVDENIRRLIGHGIRLVARIVAQAQLVDIGQQVDLGPPGMDLAPIAPRGATAADIGLEDGHPQIGGLFLEAQRGPQPAIAAADDGDIAGGLP